MCVEVQGTGDECDELVGVEGERDMLRQSMHEVGEMYKQTF